MVKDLLRLFAAFLKIGTFMIGSGYTALPLISRECVDKRGWVSEEEMADIIAVGTSLPGIVSVNAAVAVGGRVRGLAGSAAAACGVALPSIVSMTVIAAFSARLYEIGAVNSAFAGMRPAAAGLVAGAVIKLFRPAVKSIWQLVTAAACFIMIMAGVYAPYAVLACCAASVAAGAVKARLSK